MQLEPTSTPDAMSLPWRAETRADGAVQLWNAGGRSSIVLACEHASNRVPEEFGDLGLTALARDSHAAWDPGALTLSLQLAARFDAPLVASDVSRLVHDCNRPPGDDSAMPSRTEVFEIPGNRSISEVSRTRRIDRVYTPFHTTLSDLLDRRATASSPTVLVTVHSFTPVWLGQPRAVEIGLLHDRDARMVDAMLDAVTDRYPYVVLRNEPYAPDDGVTWTLVQHALPRALPNVMLEVRNDLLAQETSLCRVAVALQKLIATSLDALDIVADSTDRRAS